MFLFIFFINSLFPCILNYPLNDPRENPGEFVHYFHSITYYICVSQGLIRTNRTTRNDSKCGFLWEFDPRICGSWLNNLYMALPSASGTGSESRKVEEIWWELESLWVQQLLKPGRWTSISVTMCLSCNCAPCSHWHPQYKKNVIAVSFLYSKSHTKCFTSFMLTWNYAQKGILRNIVPA